MTMRAFFSTWFAAVRHVVAVVLPIDPQSLCGLKSYQLTARLEDRQNKLSATLANITSFA